MVLDNLWVSKVKLNDFSCLTFAYMTIFQVTVLVKFVQFSQFEKEMHSLYSHRQFNLPSTSLMLNGSLHFLPHRIQDMACTKSLVLFVRVRESLV